MRFTLIFLGWLASSCALAAVFKCTSTNGKTNYQSTPCAEGQGNMTVDIKTGTITNLDELQKQQEQTQKEELSTKEQEQQKKQQAKEQQERINKEAISESDKNQVVIKNNPDTFSAYSIPPYVPGQLSDLVKNFQDRLADIERLRRAAANKALASGNCTRVEASELDTKSTKNLLAFLVNCSSGKAFYYTEQDLK